jgi:hypothetical protein
MLLSRWTCAGAESATDAARVQYGVAMSGFAGLTPAGLTHPAH